MSKFHYLMAQVLYLCPVPLLLFLMWWQRFIFPPLLFSPLSNILLPFLETRKILKCTENTWQHQFCVPCAGIFSLFYFIAYYIVSFFCG